MTPAKDEKLLQVRSITAWCRKMIFQFQNSVFFYRKGILITLAVLVVFTTGFYMNRNSKVNSITNYGTVFRYNERPNKIVIATVTCSKGGSTVSREEAAVMIKSVIISTMLNHRVEENGEYFWVDFHIFVEHSEDVEYFQGKLKEFGAPFPRVDIALYFHSALEGVPREYQKKMIYDKGWRCMYVRLFLTSSLPKVDAVLYVDTDVIFTGNLFDIWNYLGKMDEEQAIGVAPDFQGDNPISSVFFDDIPVPPPKGLNSGVLLMNLTKLRDNNWEPRLVQLFKDYTPNLKMMNDQKLLNLMLYYDDSLLIRLPCHFNYWILHCVKGEYCDGPQDDPLGIQLIHGAVNQFESERAFSDIFLAYQQINLTSGPSLDLRNDLMLPIREAYSIKYLEAEGDVLRTSHNECDGTLNRLLFKNHF